MNLLNIFDLVDKIGAPEPTAVPQAAAVNANDGTPPTVVIAIPDEEAVAEVPAVTALAEGEEAASVAQAVDLLSQIKGGGAVREEYLDYIKNLRQRFGQEFSTKVHQAAVKMLGNSVKELDEAEDDELNIGDDVFITGNVQFSGATGRVVDFGRDKNFVVVDLYNHGKRSFHASNVEFNDYAGSEEEENDWQERDNIHNIDESQLDEVDFGQMANTSSNAWTVWNLIKQHGIPVALFAAAVGTHGMTNTLRLAQQDQGKFKAVAKKAATKIDPDKLESLTAKLNNWFTKTAAKMKLDNPHEMAADLAGLGESNWLQQPVVGEGMNTAQQRRKEKAVKMMESSGDTNMDKWMQRYESNEDSNNHTENGVLVADLVGDDEQQQIMRDILQRHEQRGEISPADQMLRDKLVKMLWPKVEARMKLWQSKLNELTFANGNAQKVGAWNAPVTNEDSAQTKRDALMMAAAVPSARNVEMARAAGAKDAEIAHFMKLQGVNSKIIGELVGQIGKNGEKVKEAAKTPAQKRDFKNMMAGAMSRDEYNKKHGLGKHAAKSGKSKLDPTGVYHNLIKTPVDEIAKGPSPGWMLRQDPALGQKVKDAKKGYQDLKKYAGQDIPKKSGMTQAISETDNLVNKLRKAYDGIEGINPASPTYKKLIALLNSLPVEQLQTLANAKIKFVSGLARNRVNRAQQVKEDGNDRYADQLAQQVFDQYPNLSSKGSADELLDAAWKIAAQDVGVKQARYMFNYDEDFPSDFVSSYAYLQGTQGVAEGARKGLNSQVEITKGRDAGKTGWVRQVKTDKLKGIKYLDIDLDGGGQTVVTSKEVKLVKQQGVAESDISGLLAASELNKVFLVTINTAEKAGKKFKVKAQSPRVAQEKITRAYPQSEIVSVKEITEGVAEGNDQFSDEWKKTSLWQKLKANMGLPNEFDDRMAKNRKDRYDRETADFRKQVGDWNKQSKNKPAATNVKSKTNKPTSSNKNQDNSQTNISDNAYEIGYRAGVAGKSKSSNPFEDSNVGKAMEWEDGWKEGRSTNKDDDFYEGIKGVAEEAGDVVTLHQHRNGTDMGKYGTFNVDRETPTVIVVHDHKTGEMLKFNRATGRGIGSASQLMIKQGVAEGWGAEKQQRDLAPSNAAWSAMMDKYVDNAEMIDYLKMFRSSNWSAEKAEEGAKKWIAQGKPLPQWYQDIKNGKRTTGYKLS